MFSLPCRFVVSLFAVMFASGLLLSAQDSNFHEPLSDSDEFFAEGKEWEISHFYTNPYYLNHNGVAEYKECRRINVKVNGKEEVDGKLCKRLEITQDHKGKCGNCTYWHIPEVMYALEENGKVYVYRIADYISPGSDEPGSLAEAYEGASKSFQELTYTGEGRASMQYYNAPGGKSIEWIDGVGWNYGFGPLDLYRFDIATGGDYPYYMMVKCQHNGKTLYDHSEELTSILDSTTGVCEIESVEYSEIYYNLQGNKVSNLQKGELYICNGKKILYY